MRNNPEHQQLLVNSWNRTYPIGTPVIRYKLIDPLSEGNETKTRSAAWLMGGHTAMVMVEGVAGGVVVQSVIPIALLTDKQREDLAPLA